MLIPIEQQELDYYKAMLQKTYEVRKLINDRKIPLQKKLFKIKEVLNKRLIDSSLVYPSLPR